MKLASTDVVLKQVAAKHGVSTEEVTREMNNAIILARATASPDAQLLWDQLFGVGRVPSAAEFVLRLAEVLNGQ